MSWLCMSSQIPFSTKFLCIAAPFAPITILLLPIPRSASQKPATNQGWVEIPLLTLHSFALNPPTKFGFIYVEPFFPVPLRNILLATEYPARRNWSFSEGNFPFFIFFETTLARTTNTASGLSSISSRSTGGMLFFLFFFANFWPSRTSFCPGSKYEPARSSSFSDACTISGKTGSAEISAALVVKNCLLSGIYIPPCYCIHYNII